MTYEEARKLEELAKKCRAEWRASEDLLAAAVKLEAEAVATRAAYVEAWQRAEETMRSLYWLVKSKPAPEPEEPAP